MIKRLVLTALLVGAAAVLVRCTTPRQCLLWVPPWACTRMDCANVDAGVR